MGVKIMKWMMSVLVLGGLGVLAWPAVNTPNENALEFVNQTQSDWVQQHGDWVGDKARRNEILMSAVWGQNERLRR